jgi:hypothetical protein
VSDDEKVCQVDGCGRAAVAPGRCRRHDFARLTRGTRASYGGESRELVMRVKFPGGLDSARNHLVELLAVAVGENDLADEIVDALDAYLEEGPQTVQAFPNYTPNYKNELEKARAERDTAIACAEQALEQMQSTLNALRHVEAEPEKTNGHAASP